MTLLQQIARSIHEHISLLKKTKTFKYSMKTVSCVASRGNDRWCT